MSSLIRRTILIAACNAVNFIDTLQVLSMSLLVVARAKAVNEDKTTKTRVDTYSLTLCPIVAGLGASIDT